MVGMGGFETIELDFDGRKVFCSIKRKKKARRVSLRILSQREVVLVVPFRGNLVEAKKFFSVNPTGFPKKRQKCQRFIVYLDI